jgi:AcrR family transcriptional regulator
MRDTPKRQRTLPRRQPRSALGQHIVNAILDGATTILAGEGYHRFTTNLIAKRAGVSIGSLYQYFAGKQAIIAGIARRLEDRALELMMTQLLSAGSAPIQDVAAGLIPSLAGERLGHVAMRREILRHVPRSWTEDVSLAVDTRARDALARYLEQRGDVRRGDAGLMAFVLVHSIEALLEVAVLQRPELLTDPSFLAELAYLATSYLQHREPAALAHEPRMPDESAGKSAERREQAAAGPS